MGNYLISHIMIVTFLYEILQFPLPFSKQLKTLQLFEYKSLLENPIAPNT